MSSKMPKKMINYLNLFELKHKMNCEVDFVGNRIGEEITERLWP
jgi:hypothetical protein